MPAVVMAWFAGEQGGTALGQLLAGVPRPPKELKGFATDSLAPGETRRVTLTLAR